MSAATFSGAIGNIQPQRGEGCDIVRDGIDYEYSMLGLAAADGDYKSMYWHARRIDDWQKMMADYC